VRDAGRRPNQGRTKRARRVAIATALLVLLALLVAVPAAAQKVQIRVGRGPHYIGDAVDLNVVAEGFEEDPEPQIEPGPVPVGRLTYQGVSPQVSSSITIINGQMTREKRVSFTYHYRFSSSRPGRVAIPAFSVTQGAVTRSTTPIYLELRDIEESDELAIKLRLPEGPVFVGQRARVAIEFAVSRELQRDLVSYALRVPLFESSRYRFTDDPRDSKDTELQIQTDDGTLILAGASREIERNGKKYLIVRAERTLIPLEAGTFDIEAASVTVDRGTRFRRDMFRSRQATSVSKLKAIGKAVALEVAELPSKGRPPSFGGAIGRGYSIDVTADRSVVQVGEPIVLSFHVRGDGDLTTASLPRLDAEGLLDPAQFRVPDEPPVGRTEDDGKHFEATVRVLDNSVREIPALDYSWFDAATRRFETTRSRPIALSVGAAEIIGAGAVQRRSDPNGLADTDGSNRPGASSSSSGSDGSPRGEGTAGPARSGSLALTGADLAVERSPDVLLRDDRASGSNVAALGGLYALGLAFVGLAAFDRRRRDVDPEVAARRSGLTRARREVEAALALPERDAAEALGRALRTMLASVPDAACAELDELLGECDARSYALVAGSETSLPEALKEQARHLAAQIEEAGQ